MKNNYRTATKSMTDEQVLSSIHFYYKYINNEHKGSVSNLSKAVYYENEAKKRGYSKEQITDYCNARDIAELHA